MRFHFHRSQFVSEYAVYHGRFQLSLHGNLGMHNSTVEMHLQPPIPISSPASLRVYSLAWRLQVISREPLGCGGSKVPRQKAHYQPTRMTKLRIKFATSSKKICGRYALLCDCRSILAFILPLHHPRCILQMARLKRDFGLLPALPIFLCVGRSPDLRSNPDRCPLPIL